MSNLLEQMENLGATSSLSTASQKEGQERDIGKQGLKKLLVKAGEGWETPNTGDEVKVHYTGTLNGRKIICSRDMEQPFTFTLGQGKMIKAWDQGIATMKKGERAIFTIPPELGYSDAEVGIPPNAILNFDIELISWISIKDICKDGGILKRILVEGKKWECPKDNDEVLVRFCATLEDRTIIVAKSPESGVEFYVREGYFCSAISKAVKTMKKEEKAWLIVKPQYAFGETGSKEYGVPPNANLHIDLELISWKVVEDVTDDGKVVKKILKQGEGYERPTDGSLVKIKYVARLEDGTVLEEHGFKDELFEFKIDEEQVISGLDKAVATMKKGEYARITIAPEYGYATVQTPLNVVPANSTLIYEVEMDSFIKEKGSWEMDTSEKLQACAKLKEDGNALFKACKYQRASKKYDKVLWLFISVCVCELILMQAVKIIEYDSSFKEEEKRVARTLKISCNLNNAASKLKLKDYNEAVKLCSKVLQIQSLNVKALYRRAQAHMELLDLDLAERDIKKALEVDPHNRELIIEQRAMKLKQIEYNKRHAKMYGNMFAHLNKPHSVEITKPETNEDEHMVNY